MKFYESVCSWFLKIEGSVSRADFIIVRLTFDFLVLIATKTFVVQLAENVNLLLSKRFLSNVPIFRLDAHFRIAVFISTYYFDAKSKPLDLICFKLES